MAEPEKVYLTKGAILKSRFGGPDAEVLGCCHISQGIIVLCKFGEREQSVMLDRLKDHFRLPPNPQFVVEPA